MSMADSLTMSPPQLYEMKVTHKEHGVAPFAVKANDSYRG